MKYKIIPVTSFNQNCSLIWCEEKNEAALIDPGGDGNLLNQVICLLSLKVKKILLTHGHVDHVGAAKELADCYGIPIIGPHFDDQWLFNNLSVQCCMLNFNNVVSSFTPDFWLKDNEIIKIGNFELNALHCPGHSPGHLVFWNKHSKFIFMGDVLFKGSIGRTDLPGGNINDLMESVQKLITLGDDISFLPGHGAMSTLGYERHYNPFVKNLT